MSLDWVRRVSGRQPARQRVAGTYRENISGVGPAVKANSESRETAARSPPKGLSAQKGLHLGLELVRFERLHQKS